jgi:hypothetical protein
MMFWWLIGAGALVALFVLAIFRRGLIDGRAARKLSTVERAQKAWTLTADDEIKPLKVGPVCGTKAADATGGVQRSADPETKPPGRCAAAPSHQIPEVQRVIEMTEVCTVANAFARQHPREVIVIHAHQGDARGQEIRN